MDIEEQIITKCHDYLEQTMMGLNAQLSEQERRLFLSGCIETLHFFGTIPDEIYDELLLLYGT